MTSPKPLDKILYERVKKMADKRFQSKTGVYKSSWIVREYKRLGGRYDSAGKPSNKTGLKRWYKEDWVDLNRPIKREGKVVGYEQCGRRSILKKSEKKDNKYPLCRPTKRVTFRTPRLVSEISEQNIKVAKREKQRVKGSKNIKFGGGEGKDETKKHLKQFLEQKKLEKEIKKNKSDKKEKKRRVSKAVEEIFKDIEKGKTERMRGGPHPYEQTYLQLSPVKAMTTKQKQIQEKSFKETQERIREMFPPKYEWMKYGGGGRAQFYGKKSEVMIEIPKNVKKWAEQAFKLKNLGFGGSLETGWKRAEQLTTKTSIPIEDLRYMRNWYARHIFASYPSFKAWIKEGKPNTGKWHRKHGIISWLTWGGNAGFNWVNSKKVIDLLNKHFNKDYKKINI